MAIVETDPLEGLQAADLELLERNDPAKISAKQSRLLRHPLQAADDEGIFDCMQSIEDHGSDDLTQRHLEIVEIFFEAGLLIPRLEKIRRSRADCNGDRYCDLLRKDSRPEGAVAAIMAETGRSRDAVVQSIKRYFRRRPDSPFFRHPRRKPATDQKG